MSFFRRGLMMQAACGQQSVFPLEFDGVDDYYDTGTELWGKSKFTMMMTFTTTQSDSVERTLFTANNYGDQQVCMVNSMKSGSSVRYFINGIGMGTCAAGVKCGLILEKDGAVLRYRLVKTNTDAMGLTLDTSVIPPDNSGQTLLFGADRTIAGYGRFWEGTIHNFMIAGRQLPAVFRMDWFAGKGL